MSIVALTASVPAAKEAQASVDFSKPVSKPRKNIFRLIGEVLDHGGPGYLQFAITNICNAKCDFCGFAARYDGTALVLGGTTGAYLCVEHARTHIDVLGAGRGTYLMEKNEVPQQIQERVDRRLAELGRDGIFSD